jgi:hypothetical protein
MGANKNSWRLVVDTDVTSSAGKSEAPRSKNCRTTLETIRDEGHSIVMTDDINDEWRRHRSKYALHWLTSMYARKKVSWVDISPSDKLRSIISTTSDIESKRQAMEKDVHLLEAALVTDQKVLSLDDTVRNLFSNLCSRYNPIKVISWLNPDTQNERVIQWLKLVPKDDQTHCLVHWSDEAND